MIKLNDIYYNCQCKLESYYQTSNREFLHDATLLYYMYKKRNGAKVIDRLENELIKYELEYI